MINQTWTRLKPLHKAGLIVAALALAGGGSAVAINAFSGDDGPAPAFVAPEQQASDPAPSATTEDPPAEAGTHKKTLTETEPIKFKTRTVKDNWLPKGQKEQVTAGIDGVRTLTYSVTLVDGKETGRKLVKSVVTRKPVDAVTSVGTATEN